MKHELPVKVFYEDTDFAGIVYYANYLKYIERGRSSLVWDAGISQTQMKDAGIVFVVRHVDADYLSPAKFEDNLVVVTEINFQKGVKLHFEQAVMRANEILFKAKITVVCMSLEGKPTRLPDVIWEKLRKFDTSESLDA